MGNPKEITNTPSIRNMAKVFGVRPGMLGPIELGIGTQVNGTNDIITVPAGYLYLLWNWSFYIDVGALTTGYASLSITDVATTIFMLTEKRPGVALTELSDHAELYNPFPMPAATRLRLISSSANITAGGSYMIEKISTKRL